MKLQIYQVLHVVSMVLLTAFIFQSFANPDPKNKKRTGMITGILALTMLVGRFFMIIPVLAIAGAMLGKKTVVPGPGTFPTNGLLFVGLLVAVVIIVGALTFFPALSLGPVLEHYAAGAGQVF